LTKNINFAKIQKQKAKKRNISKRIKDFEEIEQPLSEKALQEQASRCMDCGVAFCHSFGCPLANRIPDINTLVYQGKWKKALQMLHSTNNFPEFTGKLCPALCEASCTLELDYESVAIKQIENKLVEKGWQAGWIHPQKPEQHLAARIAIIGSGPTGMTAAQQLVRTGFKVTVFEKDPEPGGLLRYGIPDFKMDKALLDRRVDQLKQEGITFETRVEIGRDISLRYLKRSFAAILFAIGTPRSKGLNIPGKNLNGITTAIKYLTSQNKVNSGEIKTLPDEMNARNKSVVIIGGGDTGSDCVGTAVRQGAEKVTVIEILPQPPLTREPDNPWPLYPHISRKNSSIEEGGEILWNTLSTEFLGNRGQVRAVKIQDIEWENNKFKKIPSTESEIPADMVILSLGFELDQENNLYNNDSLAINEEGLLLANDSKIFTSGDCAIGPSLIVNTINQGRQAAQKIIEFLL
jgi:NAD(P)H-dependent glutamate synthase small subunit